MCMDNAIWCLWTAFTKRRNQTNNQNYRKNRIDYKGVERIKFEKEYQVQKNFKQQKVFCYFPLIEQKLVIRLRNIDIE